MRHEKQLSVVLIGICTLIASTIAMVSTVAVPDSAASASPYANAANWTCRPDLPVAKNPCLTDLSVTSIAADGSLTVNRYKPAVNAAIDCFYVELAGLDTLGTPTFDQMRPSLKNAVEDRGAQFSRVCKMYSPVWREAQGVSSIPATEYQADTVTSYADVANAFAYYLRNYNHGRPFVLIGSSQAASALVSLVQKVIAPDPTLRKHMVSAVVTGTEIPVPNTSSLSTSSLISPFVPPCRTDTQFGCVIGYSTYFSSAPPQPNALFGIAPGLTGYEDLCANPASLATGGGNLQPIFRVRAPFEPVGVNLYSPGSLNIKTPYVTLPGLVAATCDYTGVDSYLSLDVNQSPGIRPTAINPDEPTPQWGAHRIDLDVALGNVLTVLRAESRAYVAAHRR